MKKNIMILIGVVALFAVLYGVKVLVGGDKVSDIKSEVNTKSFVGQVVRVFEGEHTLEYNLNIPDTATTTIDMDGALIRITDGDNYIASVYMSYEGGRGYSPIDYIDNVIAPKVAAVDLVGTSTIGSYDWQVAESVGSEWHVAKVSNGEWLIVVENKKSVHDIVRSVLDSINVK